MLKDDVHEWILQILYTMYQKDGASIQIKKIK